MKGLPEGYTARPMTLEDAEIAAALANEYACAITGEAVTSAQHFQRFMGFPGMDLESSSRIVSDPTGEPCALGLVMDFHEPHVRISGWVPVLERAQGLGIGSVLHDWAVAQARRAIERAPADALVVFTQNAHDENSTARAFLANRNYQRTRSFWRMAATLGEELDEPVFPSDITLRHIDLTDDAELRRVVAALDEAFQDHYGHVEGDLEERFEAWKYQIANDPNLTSELSLVAMDGEEIAGCCIASSKFESDATRGYVNSLGVRRLWRGRGIALALLQHTFQTLRLLGRDGVALHVDSESPTGATRLYEKADMHVDQLTHEYHLELRSGIDLSTQTGA